jgi:hypothetical protein
MHIMSVQRASVRCANPASLPLLRSTPLVGRIITSSRPVDDGTSPDAS